MKHNWDKKPLHEISEELFAGGDVPRDCLKEKKSEYQIPVFTNGVEREGLYGFCKNPRVKKPSVTIASRGTIGVVFKRTQPFYPAIRLITVVPKDVVVISFLAYFLKSKSLSGNGVTIPQLTVPMVRNIQVPIPSKEYQSKIVKELDEINGMIDIKREQLKQLDLLAQSIFYTMFGDPNSNPKGWDMKQLKDLVHGKLSYGSGTSGIKYNGDVRYIRITDIDEYGKLRDEIAASPSELDEKYSLNDGDLLFARSGATVGKSFLYRSTNGRAIYAGYLIKATPNLEYVMSQYLYQFTKSPYYWGYIKKSIRGAAQPNVNAQLYGNLVIPVPPLTLQERFAAKVEAIESRKMDIETTIKELQTLLDSRMDYWFN